MTSPTLRESQSQPSWITPQMIERTVAIWSKRSKKQITEADAVTILVNAARLLDVLTSVDNNG